jgi:tripartite-type tricarboxylate transporter receptor subunit TctC
MRGRALAFVSLVFALIAGAAQAQTKFPDRPIRIIVPFAAGGGVDAFARLLAQKMQDKLGSPVVVENRAGANATLGGSAVMQAAPDGHTLLFSASTHISARLVMSKAPSDPISDFTPIARVGAAPMLLVMSPKKTQNTAAEAAAAAKANPADWNAATAALGSPGHLAMIAFGEAAGFKPQIVAYRGTAPALNDVAGGHVQLYFDAMIALLPMVQSGGIKGLAITSPLRHKLAPGIPTTAESGMPQVNIHSWYAFWGPKGMPADLVKQIHDLATEMTTQLAHERKLEPLGIDPVAESTEAFARFQAQEVERNAALLKSVDFQPN